MLCTLFGLAAAPVWPSLFSMGVAYAPDQPGRATNLMMLFSSPGSFAGNLSIGALTDAVGVGDAFYLVSLFAFMGLGIFSLCGHVEKSVRKRSEMLYFAAPTLTVGGCVYKIVHTYIKTM